jgi:hypothetical protein
VKERKREIEEKEKDEEMNVLKNKINNSEKENLILKEKLVKERIESELNLEKEEDERRTRKR